MLKLKNDRSKSKFCYWFLFFALLLLCGCGKAVGEYNMKADNPLSEAVYKKVGGEDVFYAGTYYKNDVTTYVYTLRKFDKEVIRNFTDTVQQALCKEETKVRVRLELIFQPSPRLVTETVFVLQNYSSQSGSEADYIGLRWALVFYPDFPQDEVLADPLTYTALPKNLRYIEMSEEFKSKAEELQIDWKEFFPELETFQYTP